MKPLIFFLKQKIFRPNALIYYFKVIKNQIIPEEGVNLINWNKRLAIVRHAYETVPYYQKRFNDIGLKPENIKKPEDWYNVPILTRQDLTSNFHDLISKQTKQKDLLTSTTGGSSGKPVKVYHDRRYPQEVLGWRMLSWWGLQPGTDSSYAWRLVRTTRFKKMLNYLMWWPTKRLWLDASSISVPDMVKFIGDFNRIKPELLQGYAGAIHSLATFIDRNSISVNPPKAVWVTSSPVSSVQRTLIEKTFNAPLYDQYGCGEIFWLAAQCKERNGLHIFADARHIEFLDEIGTPCSPGKIGKIVITDLENFAFPLIRYENGDIGRQLDIQCPCGVTLPLMDSVKGRITDMVRLPDNTLLSGDYLTTIFDDFPEAVDAFQVLQKSDYSIVIKVVPNLQHKGYTKIFDMVKARLEEKTRKQVHVKIEIVEEIQNDRGKTRYVISEV